MIHHPTDSRFRASSALKEDFLPNCVAFQRSWLPHLAGLRNINNEPFYTIAQNRGISSSRSQRNPLCSHHGASSDKKKQAATMVHKGTVFSSCKAQTQLPGFASLFTSFPEYKTN
ncbi:hypothetical protein DPSP01_000195 [Paraphaeosphaeria sporulosa]